MVSVCRAFKPGDHFRTGLVFKLLSYSISAPQFVLIYSNHLKIRKSSIQMVIFLTQRVSSFQMVKSAILFLTIQKPDWFSDHRTQARLIDHLKTGQVCPVFRCLLNTGPFDFKTQINHLNTGLVRYSDDNCASTKTISY